MLKNFFGFLFHYKFLNPILRLIMLSSYYIPELNKIKRGVQIVVSLSSDEDNFDNLECTLYSLFNQKVMPDKVVLWLSNEYELSELPYSITKYVKSGLDIRFVEWKGSYTKIIYALKEFKSSIIVTADDNIYYPKNWLLKLYHSYISHPQDIHVHNISKVKFDNNEFGSFRKWEKFVNTEKTSFLNFPIYSGGVLYPPNCFVNDILREDIYKNKVNTIWEVWSWVMSVVSDRKVRQVKNHINRFAVSGLAESFKKYNINLNQSEQKDEQLKQLLVYYGNNIYKKLEEK